MGFDFLEPEKFFHLLFANLKFPGRIRPGQFRGILLFNRFRGAGFLGLPKSKTPVGHNVVLHAPASIQRQILRRLGQQFVFPAALALENFLPKLVGRGFEDEFERSREREPGLALHFTLELAG